MGISPCTYISNPLLVLDQLALGFDDKKLLILLLWIDNCLINNSLINQ